MTAANERTPRLIDTIRVLRIGVNSLYRSRLPQMAAALAFRTLFAIIPMLVISVAAIGAFAEPDDVRSILYSALDSAGISDIMVPDAGDEARDPAPGTEPPTDGSTPAASPDSEPVRLEAFIAQLIERMLSIPFGAIGAVGVLTLIYAAISMLIEIERAFNTIFRAQVGKSWGKRITQYWAIITLVPILLFTAFYVSEQFRGFGQGLLGPAAGSVFSVAITSLLLLLAYTIIPNTRVHMRTAIVGAIVAAVFWELAKWGFRQYLDFSVSYAKLYGSMAVLPLFMLWVYLTWLIILFGLQVSYGLQHIELARQIDEQDAEKRLTDPAAVLGVLAIIAERFTRGKTTGPGIIADELSLPHDVVGTILDKLTRAGVLHPVDGALDSFTLARPAEHIALEELVAAMSEITDSGQVSAGSWTGAIQRVRQAQLDIIRGETVASLLDNPAAGAT